MLERMLHFFRAVHASGQIAPIAAALLLASGACAFGAEQFPASPTAITSGTSGAATPDYGFEVSETPVLVRGNGHEVQTGSVGTTKAVTFRITRPSGQPVPGLQMAPKIISEPEGVREHIQFTPSSGVTNLAGEFHTVVRFGDKPGRYEVLLSEYTAAPQTPVPRIIEFVARESNWPTMFILGLAGGLAVFLFGIKTASDGLQAVAGGRLRSALATMTRNPLMGLLLGIAITVFTQSSGATTLMLMSFVRAKLLTFPRSLGVILGASIGGTVTVQLISLNLSAYALPAVALGFVLHFAAKRPQLRAAGLSFFGFGLLFLGMRIMTEQMAPLKAFPSFRDAVLGLGSHPIWAVILSALFTAAFQSSGATLGVVLSLARQDLISLAGAVPICYGASIGICFTGITGSVGAPAEARRIAWAHLVYKIAGVLLFLPLTGLLNRAGMGLTRLMCEPSAGGVEFTTHAIANTYTLFISVTALLAMPFIPLLERLTRALIPDPPEYESDEPRTKYLDLQILDTPSVALGSVRREISRMGRFVEEMMKYIPDALIGKDDKIISFIRQRDHKVDHLNTEITHYLTDLTKRTGSEEESREATNLLYIVSDLEHIGDIIDKNLVPLADKMIARNYSFSEGGTDDLRKLHHRISEDLSQTVIALTTANAEMVKPILEAFSRLQEEGKHLHMRHLQRLQGGLRESIETSSVHIDAVNYLLQIESHIHSICLHAAGR